MSDLPNATDLLATARSALVEELLPLLPDSARYLARMIANAIDIAVREFSDAPLDERLRTELAALAITDETDLQHIGKLLTRRIRSGAFSASPELRAKLHLALSQWTLARLAISDSRMPRASSG